MTGKIVKIADNAFFVPSYSDQTIMRAYDTQSTVQSLSDGTAHDEYDREPDRRYPAHSEPALPS